MDLPKDSLSRVNRYTRPREKSREDFYKTAAQNDGTGWIYHQDNARLDRANALSIPEGVRAQITIDGLGENATDDLDTIRREGATPLLSSGKFYPQDAKDNYLLRFGFMAAIVDPGLTNSEDINGLKIEFDVGGAFNVHEAYTAFLPDPGPVRMERNNWNALSGVSLVASLVSPRLAALNAILSAAVSHQQSTGQKFIEFGQAFAGPAVVQDGVSFFVTPSTDVEIWGADLTITRLSSPTT